MPKMSKLLLLVLLGFISPPVLADGKARLKNDCDNPVRNQEFEDLLVKHPADLGIIRLLAIRKGLCELIAKNQIPLQTGLELWALERQKILGERTKAELSRIRKKALE